MFKLETPLNAVSATTTSEPIDISGAKKVSLLLTRTNHTAGSTTFDVDVSVDGITYVDFNKLISNAANTNSQTITRVATVALSSNTSSVVALDLVSDCYRYIKITATIATDGKGTAKALIEL